MRLSVVRCLAFASLLLASLLIPFSKIRAQGPASPSASAASIISTDNIRTVARALKPAGLAVDSQNRVYFTSANRVFRVLPSVSNSTTDNIELIAGTGQRGSLGDGGPATSAQLNLASTPAQPSALTIDSADNLYILDSGNETIRRVDAATGIISTIVGRWAHPSVASSYLAIGELAFAPAADSPASSRLFFETPAGLVTADLATDAFTPITGSLAEIFHQQNSSPGATNTSNVANASSVPPSAALAISPDAREIYIASPAGLFRASLATGLESSARATLLHPPLAGGSSYSLAVSPAGQLYISVAAENRILRFDSQTHSLTPVATGAQLNQPGAIAFDHLGNLFVADTNNDAIREIPLATGSVTLFPTRYPFATQLVGGQTPPHQFVLTNGTSGTISGVSIQFVGGATPPDYIETNTCASQLGPSQTCDIDVSFAPQATGQRTAILSVTDSDPSSPQTAELTGLADDFNLALQSGTTDTLTVVAGGKATYQLQVTSQDFSGKVAIGCPNNLPLYVTCTITPSSVDVTPTAPQKFSVVFQTTTRITSLTPPTAPRTPINPALFNLARLSLLLLALFVILAVGQLVSRWPRTSNSRRLALYLATASAFLILLSASACGKKTTTTTLVGTAAGTYDFTITAVAQNATRAISLTLTVQ